ncbi:MAG: hypothetical protein ACOX5G_01710 [Kiritimatiellia bacterium]
MRVAEDQGPLRIGQACGGIGTRLVTRAVERKPAQEASDAGAALVVVPFEHLGEAVAPKTRAAADAAAGKRGILARHPVEEGAGLFDQEALAVGDQQPLEVRRTVVPFAGLQEHVFPARAPEQFQSAHLRCLVLADGEMQAKRRDHARSAQDHHPQQGGQPAKPHAAQPPAVLVAAGPQQPVPQEKTRR